MEGRGLADAAAERLGAPRGQAHKFHTRPSSPPSGMAERRRAHLRVDVEDELTRCAARESGGEADRRARVGARRAPPARASGREDAGRRVAHGDHLPPWRRRHIVGNPPTASGRRRRRGGLQRLLDDGGSLPAAVARDRERDLDIGRHRDVDGERAGPEAGGHRRARRSGRQHGAGPARRSRRSSWRRRNHRARDRSGPSRPSGGGARHCPGSRRSGHAPSDRRCASPPCPPCPSWSAPLQIRARAAT